MSFFKLRGDPSVSISEVIDTFQEIARPLVANGDIDEVNRLYAKAYAQAMKGRKGRPLEEMGASRAMKLALHDVLTDSARKRRHYFATYRDNWWRQK